MLRAPEPRDRPTFVDLLASPEVHTYLGGPRPRADLERELPGTPENWPGSFVVDRGGAMIGHILLRRATTHRHPAATGRLDLGYLFLPHAWGAGYATEACTAALAWLSATFPTEPVILTTQAANTPSMRLASRLGFTELARFEAWNTTQCLALRQPA